MAGDRTSDYDYPLPPDRIAQNPVEPRDASRLMVVDRARGTIAHLTFRDLLDLISPDDAIVLNTSRVIKARLLGTRVGSGAPAEVLLLRPLGDDRFEALVRPGGKLGPGRTVQITPELLVDIERVTERRTRIVRLRTPLPIDAAIDRFGHVPLPPYVARKDIPTDVERYQTVYARERGSVAAPTAGLHFTRELLHAMGERGVRRADVLLHVGAGTFKPVEVDDPAAHLMHEEWYDVPAETVATIATTQASGHAVWAVGTTTARTLESAAAGVPPSADPVTRVVPRAGSSETRLFIRPPYQWRVVDRLITNFHLPRSTLLMLVAAFAGYDLTMRAYQEAVARGYRFYSYGDAMVVI